LVVAHTHVNRAQKIRRRTFRAHGRINPPTTFPITDILPQKWNHTTQILPVMRNQWTLRSITPFSHMENNHRMIRSVIGQ
jgi:hypothetical protein